MSDDISEFLAAYDAVEGYPKVEWIERFNKLAPTDFGPHAAARFLVSSLPEIAETISCVSVTVEDGKDELLQRDDVKKVEYHTGGWSGAEDLINAMLRQFWISHFHTVWRRGGHFYFEVPVRFLDGQ